MTQPITFACVVLSTLQQRRCAGLMLLHMLHASIRCLPGNFGLQRVSLINLDGRVSLGRWNFNREIPCTVNKNTHPPRNNMEAKKWSFGIWISPFQKGSIFSGSSRYFSGSKMVFPRILGVFSGAEVRWSPSQESCIHPVANFKKNDRGWDLWDMRFVKWMGSIYMGVSENSGFSPQIIHFNRVFHYKPSILGYPYIWKHPFISSILR